MDTYFLNCFSVFAYLNVAAAIVQRGAMIASGVRTLVDAPVMEVQTVRENLSSLYR